MIRLFTVILTLLLLGGCSSKQQPRIENSYVQQTTKLTAHGLDALQHGRLVSARRSLDGALRTAWLSADLKLVGQAEYHLGALYLAQSKRKHAAEMLKSARQHAQKAGDNVTVWRAQFAYALLLQKQGMKAEALPELQAQMPGDVYLSAARLAQLQSRWSDSEQAYQHVLGIQGSDAGVLYQRAQAHLGLALLARDTKQSPLLLKQADDVLLLSKQAGFPLLAAHALFLLGSSLQEAEKLERAWQMYQALDDKKGQRDSLKMLLELAEKAKDEQRMQQWQRAMDGMPGQER